MNQENRPPMKNDPALAAPKDHPVDRAVLLVDPRGHLGVQAVLLVGPRDHLGAQAVLLAGPGDHPAKKSSEPDPPPPREQPQVQANRESLFTEMPTKGSSRRALESS